MKILFSLIKNPIATLIIGIVLTAAAYPILEGYWKKPITLTCNPAPCNCPEQKPCNGIDFDKIKSKAITIENTQYITARGDSLLEDRLAAMIRQELNKLRLARCK